MSHLVLEGLSRTHAGSGEPSVQDLTLDLAEGELLCLVGPSGCGKSTTLRLIAGLDTPDRGRIVLGGRDLQGVPPQDRDVAMVFQGYALYPHLTVEDNLAFPLKMRRLAREDRAARVRETADLLGLGALLRRLPGELSGGERQRVAMGRALVRQPKLFLFDEPLANLDAALRTELRVELGQLLRKLGTASLYVTHDQVEAMTLGDRLAVLRRGRLEQVGTPRDVYERPSSAFVAGFLGSPPMNLLELTPSEAGFLSPTADRGVRFEAPSGPGRHEGNLTVGLRPEHLRPWVEGAPAPGERTLGARVLSTEPLGAETLVRLDLGPRGWLLRLPGFATLSPGTLLRVTYASKHLHWFSTETGARLEAAP